MAKKLFQPIQEQHDGRGRIVFICEDPQGFYVYKPGVGLKTRHWPSADDPALLTAFNRQVGCTQNVGFLEEGEAPAADENYSLQKPKTTAQPAATDANSAAATTQQQASKTAPAKQAPRKQTSKKTDSK